LDSEATNLLQGNLDLLILRSLIAGEMHGSGVSRRISENNRRAKYNRLTKARWKQLEVETERWGHISWAIAQALEASQRCLTCRSL
jgi:PadR family transcriptional regulator PadR